VVVEPAVEIAEAAMQEEVVAPLELRVQLGVAAITHSMVADLLQGPLE
jgi:hypothetical protein